MSRCMCVHSSATTHLESTERQQTLRHGGWLGDDKGDLCLRAVAHTCPLQPDLTVAPPLLHLATDTGRYCLPGPWAHLTRASLPCAAKCQKHVTKPCHHVNFRYTQQNTAENINRVTHSMSVIVVIQSFQTNPHQRVLSFEKTSC